MKIYVVGDSHFDDRVVFRFRKKGFKDIKDMNNILSSMWKRSNRVVFLGDMTREIPPRYWINKLKPFTKYIIKGNHDVWSFPLVYQMKVNNIPLLFIHNPKHVRKHYNGWVIHGHVHSNVRYPFFDPVNKRVNVAWDKVGAPVPLSLIIYMIKQNYPTIHYLWEVEKKTLRPHYNGSLYMVDEGKERFYGRNS